MRARSLVLLGAALASMWLAIGPAYAQEAKGQGATATIGGVQLEIIPPNGGMAEGENAISVQVSDSATGKPVVQSGLRVEMTMDAGDRSMNHGDMSNQKPVVAELQPNKEVPGRYDGKVSLSGAGRWNAKIYLDSQRSTIVAVSVAPGGPIWLVVAGGAVVVFALAGVGVVLLRRGRAAPASQGSGAEAIDRARLTFSGQADR